MAAVAVQKASPASRRDDSGQRHAPATRAHRGTCRQARRAARPAPEPPRRVSVPPARRRDSIEDMGAGLDHAKEPEDDDQKHGHSEQVETHCTHRHTSSRSALLRRDLSLDATCVFRMGNLCARPTVVAKSAPKARMWAVSPRGRHRKCALSRQAVAGATPRRIAELQSAATRQDDDGMAFALRHSSERIRASFRSSRSSSHRPRTGGRSALGVRAPDRAAHRLPPSEGCGRSSCWRAS